MSGPSSLRSFMAPVNTQGENTAVGTTPNIEMTLLAKEQQAWQDANDLVKALEEANCKHEELVNKRRDAQAAQEEHKAEQCEADPNVRGKLLANAAVAEVWCQFVHQAEKAMLAAEKLQTEWEVLWSPWKVRMRLGVSFSLSSSLL